MIYTSLLKICTPLTIKKVKKDKTMQEYIKNNIGKY